MTTEECSVRTERADAWPVFRDLELSAVDVISIECGRGKDESLAVATARAAVVLQRAFSELMETAGITFVLAASEPITVPSRGKVAALNAERKKLWNSWDRDGVVLPPGRREEWNAASEEHAVRYAGYIECALEHLPQAVEITRTRDALLYTARAASVRDEILATLRSVVASSGRRDEMLRSSLRVQGGDILIIRGFGEFDDAVAGVEVFGKGRRVSDLARYVACRCH